MDTVKSKVCAHSCGAAQKIASVTRLLGISHEPCNDFLDHSIRLGLNLAFGLVLNRVRHVNRIKIRTPQRRGLRSGRQHELVRGDRDRRQSQVFKS